LPTVPDAGPAGPAAPASGFVHRPGLDGLRAWAVLAVLAFHSGALRAGWVGVDVFFALSGFLITGLIVAEFERTGTVSLTRFWGRRARRLLPARALLFLVVAVGAATTPGAWVGATASDVWGSATYTANWVRLAGDVGYWDQFRAPGPLEHTWSLAVEEQFYVVWPVLMVVVLRRWGRRGAVCLAAVAALATAAAQVGLALAGSGVERLYVGTDTRAPAFALGAWCVLAADPRVARSSQWRRLVPGAAGAGLAALFGACVLLDGDARSTYVGPLLVTSAVGALTVLAAAHTRAGRLAPVVTAAPLRWIGRWSYGIYLYHWPVVVALRGWEVAPAVRFAVVAAVATVAAALSYELVEHPIRSGRLRLRALVPAAAAAIAAAGLASVALAGGALAAGGLAGQRLDDAQVAELLAPLGGAPAAGAQGAADDLPGPTAAGTDTTLAPARALHTDRVLVAGDSVPFHLRSALERAAAAAGLEVAVRAAPGCVPSPLTADQYRAENDELCARLVEQLPRDLDTYRPATLVVYYGLSGPEVREGGRTYDACAADGRSALTAQLGRILAAADGVGTRVALVPPLEPPAVDFVDRGAQLAGWRCYLAAYDAFGADHPDVDVVPILDLLCPQMRCRRELFGVALFRDGIHYSDDGAAAMAPWLLDQIAARAAAAPG
jgi:peptidoglycan/LPS O-acetylase OafA/YrhL